MPSIRIAYNIHRVRCLIRRLHLGDGRYIPIRALSQSSSLPQTPAPSSRTENQDGPGKVDDAVEEERGPMYQRLADMTARSLDADGKGAHRIIKEAGFSEDLKRQLEARLQESAFRSENPAAFADVGMPVSLNFRKRLCLLTFHQVKRRERHPRHRNSSTLDR